MSASAPLPQDHPLMRAWSAHTATPEYANSRSWAKHDEHVDGSMWAVFMAGWCAALAQAEQAEPVRHCRCDGAGRLAPECDGAGCYAERLNEQAEQAQPVALHEVMRRVRRLQRHAEDWCKWYGAIDVLARNPLPLPPAGTVRLLEDLDEAIKATHQGALQVAASWAGDPSMQDYASTQAEQAQSVGPVVTPAMVDSYLSANALYWQRIDAEPTKLGKWRNGTPREATEYALNVALAAPAAAPSAQPVAQYGGATVLPDGSAFSTASFPLPKDHWLYAPRGEWDNKRDEYAECPQPILTNAQRGAVRTAARYAIRGATMCGQDQDFDPDALVLNFCYALCGPAHGAVLPADAAAPSAPQTETKGD